MALSIVATPGSASANSFVTVEEADAYLEARLNSSAWTGTDPKMQALVEATREISAMEFQGYRTDDVQALSWPRSCAEDPDAPYAAGGYFDTDVVPQRVKDATIELALEFLRAGTTDVAGVDRTAGVIEKTVGPLTTRWAEPSQRAQGIERFCPRAMNRIGPLLASSPSSVRLVR